MTLGFITVAKRAGEGGYQGLSKTLLAVFGFSGRRGGMGAIVGGEEGRERAAETRRITKKEAEEGRD